MDAVAQNSAVSSALAVRAGVKPAPIVDLHACDPLPAWQKGTNSVDRSALPNADRFFRGEIERYRRTGSKARGRCPFHKSSSHGRSFSLPFSIDLDRGLWHCFVCDAGGDLVEFVKQRDGVDFISAAKKLGVLRPLDPQQAEEFRRAKRLREAKQQAKVDAYCSEVEFLLAKMETYERIRALAVRWRDDELRHLAQQHIVRTGAAFIVLKAESGVAA